MRSTLLCVLLSCFGLLSFTSLHAQTQVVKGKVTDAVSGEALIGVNIFIVETSSGTVTDYDGNYSLELEKGSYTISFSYVGYDAVKEKVEVSNVPITLDIKLGVGKLMDEITVTADIATERETPVAFSNIPTIKLKEELAAQDLPMILNSTPGAYATESGGGDGDARITIRGFSQRNVAVMLDGIPVNDMENGWVYWSNWFGLDLVTKTMQVQRGLGASKLALPSVGGTINILTKGIDSKRSFSLRQEVGNNGYLRTTVGYNSGRLKGGWGISAAGSYKRGDGWVDANYTEGWFYYLRVDKEFKKHLISLSGFGAPQKHGQRSFKSGISTFDADFAMENGVEAAQLDSTNLSRGLRYNEHWGTLNGEELNTRKNYYHKPQFSLRHSWAPNTNFFLSNVAYLSLGSGGGTGTTGSFGNTEDGQIDLQSAFDNNQSTSIFKPTRVSESILRASVNNHFWYGLLSTFRYQINEQFNLSGGVDLRSYKGSHYREVHDLLGGEYFIGERNARVSQSGTQLVEGDKYFYDNDGFVKWGGLFSLLEYKHKGFSAFLNISGAAVGYSLEDYMYAEQIELDGETHYISYYDDNLGSNTPDILERVTLHNGTVYTVDHPSQATIDYAAQNGYVIDSTSAQNQVVETVWRPSYTTKIGAAYNINDKHSVFANTGYLSRATRFDNVINTTYRNRTIPEGGDPIPELGYHSVFEELKNEEIIAFEMGYNFKSKKFSANVNAYWTIWQNKPLDRAPTIALDPSDPESERIAVNINGLAARHTGIELDFAYKVHPKFTIEGLASYGDWIWDSAAETTLPDGSTYQFDAEGVHVGDAAQVQVGGLLRYEPVKGFYLKLRNTFFAKNFANFSPETLQGDNGGRESWKMPNYYIFSFHTGYSIKLNKVRLGVRLNILNLLNESYVADATNNDTFTQGYNAFDAKSASVFFGQGRRFSTSFNISF